MKQQNQKQETWLELSEAADYLGVHFTTLRRWADAGEISFMRTPGGRRRFSQRALEAFLKRVSAASHADKQSTNLAVMQPFQDRAIDQTRKNISSINNSDNWIARLNPEQRQLLKSTGHRLMVLLLQYNSRPDGGEVFLEEGKRIAREYSEVCAGVGLSLPETVRVFLFFRRSIVDSIHETDHLGDSFDQESLRLFHRTNDFMDALLLDLIGSYPGSSAGDII
jgi:excisionase family DNA binding protein